MDEVVVEFNHLGAMHMYFYRKNDSLYRAYYVLSEPAGRWSEVYNWQWQLSVM